jgi:isoleucyl-tRNA synthetase
VPIRCEACGEAVERIPEVGDVWLDAGIVPFSTLGWQNPSGSARATRPARRSGSRRADLPDHAYWEEWFPADWVSEMREQIRLWFYSQLFMSVASSGARRSGACSATRRCSTSTAARCTARGGT